MNAVATKRAITNLSKAAEEIRHTDPVDLSSMDVGDEWRQGDMAIIRLPDDYVSHNSSRLVVERKATGQLAPGTTQGSRHCLDSLQGVTIYRLANPTPLDGPIIEIKTPRSILHPEHGDCMNLPVGCYAFPGQRAFAAELRRTQD